MHSVRIHKVIIRIMSLFYCIGFWHRGDQPTAREYGVKWFHSIFYMSYAMSLAVGSITSEKEDERVFLADAAIIIGVAFNTLMIFIWKQRQIVALINQICVYSIRDAEDFNYMDSILERFMKYFLVFMCATWSTCSLSSILTAVEPIFASEKRMLFNIGFPLDYNSSEFAFWSATAFLCIEMLLTMIVLSCSVVIWYLMIHCSLRYNVLAREIANMGRTTGEVTSSENKIFLQQLMVSIDTHLLLRGLIVKLGSLTSNSFLLRFCTSAICICISIYAITFFESDNIVVRLIHYYAVFYAISEIYVITYFGNEIYLSSNRLSYSLFESNWIEQPQFTKRIIIIFGEYLKRPHKMLIGKLYELTLETFIKIVNSAYTFFNVLKNTNLQ